MIWRVNICFETVIIRFKIPLTTTVMLKVVGEDALEAKPSRVYTEIMLP